MQFEAAVSVPCHGDVTVYLLPVEVTMLQAMGEGLGTVIGLSCGRNINTKLDVESVLSIIGWDTDGELA